MNILAEIRRRFVGALQSFVEDPESLVDQIRPSGNPKFGDYQANLAMPLAKKLNRNPRELASEIVSQLDVSAICEPPEVAGNGFINLRLKNDWIDDQLRASLADTRLGVSRVQQPRRYVIDFSSPNVAKPMHVGHIRSTVIGDALSRILRFLGHDVITDNHLGDWGTQFGMIIYGYKHFLQQQDYEQNPVDELSRIYRVVRRLMDYHDGVASQAKQCALRETQAAQIQTLESQIESAEKAVAKKLRKERNRLNEKHAELVRSIEKTEALIAEIESDSESKSVADKHSRISSAVLEETAKLHAGDELNLGLWHEVLPHCLQDLHRIYDRLDVHFDHEHGESFYHDALQSIVDEFESKGLAKPSEGAMCVFLEDFEAPMLIRKKDGAFLYATSDLATIQYRMETWSPDSILYVVDHRQHEHFAKLFATARLWGHESVELTHVAFGTVMGEDGTPFKTRAGDIVGLESLIDEAISRAKQVVEQNSEQGAVGFDDATRQQIAEIVGLGALKYADLSQNRSTDYKFSYDNMLAMVGNTGPYLQYSYARNQGIFGRAEVDPQELRTHADSFEISTDEERALALALLRFEEALYEVTIDYRPNLLCNYVYQLSKAYSAFFDRCPVLKAETDALRLSRLKLCDLTARTVKQALELLGMKVAERM